MAMREHKKNSVKKNNSYIPYPKLDDDEELPYFEMSQMSTRIPTYEKRCDFWKKSLGPHTVKFEKKYLQPNISLPDLDLSNVDENHRHQNIVNFYKQIEIRNYQNML